MSNEPQQVKNPIQVQIVAVAVASSNVVYAVVALLLRHTGSMPGNGFVELEPEVTRILGPVLVLLGIGALFAATFLRSALTGQLTPETDTLQERMRITLMSGAVAGGAGIFGLVLVLLAGFSPAVWLLWGISLCGDILVFPTKAWLESGPRE